MVLAERTQHKSVKALLKEDAGQLTAVISTFGVVDSDGDVVEPSAFTQGQEVPMVWAHDWASPIGKGTINVQADRAVFEGAFFMNTQAGREAYERVKAMGDLQEYSWGFRITESEVRAAPPGFEGVRTWHGDGKVQYITGAEVFEVSPVLVGANRQTGTLDIKSLADVEAFLKRGARNSARDLERLIAIRDHVTELIGELEEETDSEAGKQAEGWQTEALANILAALDEEERLLPDIT